MIFLYCKGEKKLLFTILYALITEAEALYGGKTGELKKATVIKNIYGVLPAITKYFITERRLELWIEEALEYAKTRWADNAGIKKIIKAAPAVPTTHPEI